MRTLFSRHLAVTVVLGGTLAVFAGLRGSADGLVYQLAPDGSWAEFDLSLHVTAAGQQRDHKGLLRLSSVGKVKEAEQACRWLELAVTRTVPPLPDEVLKLLIPEKELRAGADLTGKILRAWRKQGEGKAEALAKGPWQLGIGPVSMFLAGPLREVKQLERQDVTIEGLGKLPCIREAGKSMLRFGKDSEVSAEFTVWRNLRAPFGTAKMQLQVRLEQDGTTLEGRFEAHMTRTGTDAKSALPDAK